MKIKVNIDIRVGRVVKYFILVDLALLAGWGLIDPVFSVFMIQNVAGATLTTIGAAAGVYWLVKSAIQLPLANYLDRRAGEKDDFYALILGLFLISASAFLFALVDEIWQLFAVQALRSVAFALYAASWPAIFSRHLDKERVSFDWALDSTAVGIAAGISGIAGGFLAQTYGYTIVFVLGAFFSMVAALILLFTPDLIIPPKPTNASAELKDHTPVNFGR